MDLAVAENRLKVGDTIKFRDSEYMIHTMHNLAKEGVDTDFLYEKDGQKGYWLEVIKVGK